MTPHKQFDLAIAGELNLDLILYGLPLQMPTERDLIGTRFVSTLGSSSAIVAHNAAVLGTRVYFATLIGDDLMGTLALDRLKHAEIDTSGIVVEPSATTGVTIFLPHGAERHSLTYLGTITELAVEHLDLAKLKQARHFHLSSLYLQRKLHGGIVDLLHALKSAGLTISLDTNDDPDDAWGSPLSEVLPFVDIFMPSEGELCRMAGVVELARAMQIFGEKVPTLVVKCGRQGCRVQQGEQLFELAGLTVEPVDTIGAGDSFDAGFLSAYLQGKALLACARAGNITGALSTLGSGGTEAFRNAPLRQAFLEEHAYFSQ